MKRTNKDTLKVLLKYLEDNNALYFVNLHDKNGDLPLTLAVEYGREDAAQLLIKYGADTHLTNFRCQTYYDLSSEGKTDL
jgi:FOG: Ankyrin repeat